MPSVRQAGGCIRGAPSSDTLTEVPFAGLLAVAIVAAVVIAIATNRVAIEFAMLAGLVLQVALGTVEPTAALAGFAHPAVVSIAALFVVAAALRETGATRAIAPALLGQPASVFAAQLRLMAPVALLSAFINNTPVVAMYLPLVRDWARRIRVSPSKLLMPLSFASILGGQLTLIGSASNLIVMGLYLEYLRSSDLVLPGATLQFWGPSLLGLPAACCGIAYLLAVAPKLLPERIAAHRDPRSKRSYTVQMDVLPGSAVAGSSIESAGLRHLPGLYLYEIERAGVVLSAPGPATRLAVGDRLGFTGILDSVVDLQKFRGLAPTERQENGPVAAPTERELAEAVIAASSPLVGRTVREARFRTLYNAAIVAVHRNGEAIRAKIGDIRLKPGDVLLLEAPQGFADLHSNAGDFYLVSSVPGFESPRHDRLGRAAAVFALLVIGLMLGPLEPVVTCLCAALLMVAAGCLPMSKALASLSLPVIVSIAAALGMSAALEQSGAADAIANGLLDACRSMGIGERGMLFAMALTASAFSQVLTKNGSAALMFPIAMATAQDLSLHPEPFAFSLLLGCGLSFMSPVAYQTNLMVYGPGGYRFLDFPRIGLPLTVLLCALCALLCPLVFPFRPLPG